MAQRRVTYAEPADYIPKELRKKYGLGEYNEAHNKKEKQEKQPGKRKLKKGK